MLLFVFIFQILCDETSTKICIYSSILPSICENIHSIDYSKVSDLDTQIELLKTNKMILIFSPTGKSSEIINYQLNAKTFLHLTVDFISSSSINDKFNLQLSYNNIQSTNSNLHIENCDLTILGSSAVNSVQFDSIELINCNVQFKNMKNSITAQAASFDSSFTSFSEIIIEGGHRNPDLTISTKSPMTIELYNLENVINNDIHIKYTNPNYRDIEIIGSSNLTFICKNTEQLSTVSIREIDNLYFERSNYDYPDQFIIQCQNIGQIHSTMSVLPITLLESSTTSYFFTTIYLCETMIISGNIQCNVAFLKSTEDAKRSTATVNGFISSNLLSINTSYLDLFCNDLRVEMNSYIDSDPFIHCIGKGGVSVITGSTDYVGFVGFNRPRFNRDFDHYLPDSELSNLLNSQELPFLHIESKNHGFESFSSPQMSYTNQTFIHGFSERDSIITIKRDSVNPLIDSISAKSPALKPLILCFGDTQCRAGQIITNDDLTDLSKNYAFTGMKNVEIQASTDINQIDLSNLPNELNLIISSTNEKITINSIAINNIINLTFKKINLPSFSVDMSTIRFIECSFQSESNKIQTTSQTNIIVDDAFITNHYLFNNFLSNSIVNNFAIQIDSMESLDLFESKFVLDSQSEITKGQNIIWSTIEFLINTDLSNSIRLIGSETVSSFNLTLSGQRETNSPFSIAIENWSAIASHNSIYLNYNTVPIQIILTEPVYLDPMIFNGSGKLTYKDQYQKTFSICVCEDETKIDLFENCNNSDTILNSFSQLNDELNNSPYDNLTVFVINSNSANMPSLNMKSLNMKYVNLISENEVQQQKGYVELNSQEQLSDPKLTTTHFHNFVITNSQTSTEFVFGELYIENSTLCGFDQSTFQVDDFICDVSLIQSIGSVYITDNLIVSGDFDLTEKDVHFVSDDNPEDLKVTISKNTQITVGNGKVTIGRTTFFIERSNMFDVVLNIENNLQIDIECETNCAVNQIPLVQIVGGQSITFDFSRSNNWPNEEYLIEFNQISDSTFVLNSKNTPINFESLFGHNIIFSKSNEIGLSGSFSNSNSQSCEIEFQSEMKCDIYLPTINLQNDVTFSILKPNISLFINSLLNPKNEKPFSLQFNLYLSLNGYSSSIIQFIDTNATLNPFIGIRLDIPNSISLNSKELDDFCNQNYTMIKTSQVNNYRLDILDPLPSLHGLTEEAFGIYQNIFESSIIFYTKLHPKNVPMALCYNTKIQCEGEITDDLLDDFSSLVPEGIQSIVIKVNKNIQSKALNLDLTIFNQIDVEIQGTNIDLIDLKLGQNRIRNLKLEMVQVNKIIDLTTFKVNKLVLFGALIGQVDGFESISVDDVASWMYKMFTKFSGQLSLTSNCQILAFESDGWKIDNEKILKENFPNLNLFLQQRSDNSLSIQCNTNKIHEIGITVDPSITNFVISKGWTTNSICINGVSNSFSVSTSSFPFNVSPLNRSTSSDQIITFSNDIEMSSSKFIFENEVLNINVGSFNGIVNEIELINSKINNDKSIKINSLTIRDGNFSYVGKVSIAKKLIVYGESKVDGEIDFSEDETTEIEYVWDIDQTPEINFTEFPLNLAMINVRFMQNSLPQSKIPSYNAFLYQKAFRLGNFGSNCKDYLSKLIFTSSVPYFDTEKSIFDSFCDDGELLIVGKRLIPDTIPTMTPTDTGDAGGDNHDSNIKLILAISIPAAIIVISISAFIIYLVIRKIRRDSEIDEQTDNTSLISDLVHQKYTEV